MIPEHTIEELIEIVNKGEILSKWELEKLKQELNNEKNHSCNSL